MANEIFTRIQLKHDSLVNWNESSIVLKPGEVGVAYVDVATKDANGNIVHVPTALMKVGENVEDSTKTFKDLPFVSALAADVYAWAKEAALYVEVVGVGEAVANIEFKATTDHPAGALVITKTDLVTPAELTEALKSYYTKDEVDAKILEINGTNEALAGRVGTLETAVNTTLPGQISAVDAKFADYTKTADLPTDLGDFANEAGYAKTADVNAALDLKADKTQVATDIANAVAPLATTEALNAVRDTAEAAQTAQEVSDAIDGKIAALDLANTYEAKGAAQDVADDLAEYVESNNTAIADRYTKAEADAKFALIADAYDDEEVRGLIAANAKAIADETTRATGIEGGLRTDVDAIKGDYLKAADKTELENKITANANAITTLTDGIDPDKIDGLTDLINWANEHAPEVASIKEDIEANTKAIGDEATRADEAEKALAGRLDVLEAIDHDAYKAADETVLSTAKGYTDTELGKLDTAYKAADEALAGRVKDLEDNKADYATKTEVATAKQEAINDAAGKYEEKGVAQGLIDGLNIAQYETITGAAGKYEEKGVAQSIVDGLNIAQYETITGAAGKYETIGTAQGIVDGLKLGETYEPIGAETRAIAAAKTETENQIAALGIADYAKTTDVEATYRRKDVAITPDDLSKDVVFIFNCGTASTVI